MSKCNKCNVSYPSNANFCSKCGGPLSVSNILDNLIDDDDDVYSAIDKNDFTLTVVSLKRDVLEHVRSSDKVQAIMDRIINELFNNVKKNIEIYSKGLIMAPNQTIGYYKFPQPSQRFNQVSILFKAKGGMAMPKKGGIQSDPNRVRKLKFKKFPDLKRSYKDDCIFGKMDGVLCAEMSCGHAMAPQTMYDYIKSIFEKFGTAYKIICPHHKNVEWDWDYCTAVADMTDDEYFGWCKERDKRKLHNFKECPFCKSLCKRREGVAIFRMNCEGCNNSDWCWECAQKWNGSGLVICGNKNCTLVQLINAELASAPLIHHLTAFQKGVPSIRACPRCLTRMKHIDACKHMKCAGCDKKFCFSCLSLQGSDGKWPCIGGSSHTFNCPIKPRQQFG